MGILEPLTPLLTVYAFFPMVPPSSGEVEVKQVDEMSWEIVQKCSSSLFCPTQNHLTGLCYLLDHCLRDAFFSYWLHPDPAFLFSSFSSPLPPTSAVPWLLVCFTCTYYPLLWLVTAAPLSHLPVSDSLSHASSLVLTPCASVMCFHPVCFTVSASCSTPVCLLFLCLEPFGCFQIWIF